MSTRHADGSVTLDPREVAVLEALIGRWHRECRRPGNGSGMAVLDIACEVREMLGLAPVVT